MEENSGANIAPSDITRALIDFLETSGVDISQAKDEQEISEMLLARLKGYGKQ